MDPIRFDRFSKLFSQRQFSRRQALRSGGTGLAVSALAVTGLSTATSAAAQDATPAAVDATGTYPEMLFVQAFQSGSIAPKDGADGRYTLTLEQGHGQTIFFSDRPDRIVGAQPTEQFIDILGFSDDNPPNAALIVENSAGEPDIAVLELFSPVYDADTATLTYDVAALANWDAELDMEFSEAPTDLSVLEASFGSAQLFIDGIDDCPGATMTCEHGGNVVGEIPNEDHDGFCQGWLFPPTCLPCQPWISDNVVSYWNQQCNERFDACGGDCEVTHWCTSGRDCPWK